VINARRESFFEGEEFEGEGLEDEVFDKGSDSSSPLTERALSQRERGGGRLAGDNER
jgi:hypothetical protein